MRTPPTLIIRTPDGLSQNLLLEQDRYTLGRASTSDLCYPDDAGLSRQHLAFERTPQGWTIRDLGSKNGTVLNGAKLGAAGAGLKHGDRMSAGHLFMEFASAEEPVPMMTSVVFIDRAAEPITDSTTVQASLEGLIGKATPKADASVAPQSLQGNPQLRALIQAGIQLASHKPLNEVFETIMDLSMDAVSAGRGVLMTVEGDDLEVRAIRGEGFKISSTVRDKVLGERASIMVRDTSLEEAFRERKSIVAQQIRSMLAVPLQTNDRVIGLIYLDSPNLIRPFTKEDLNLLTVMANVAAIRIEHARLNEVEQAEQLQRKELDQAAQIQRSLLPAQAPVVAGYALSGYNAPCRTVGGDYYDFLEFPDGKIGLIVADVSGKGLPASLMMTSLQARVQVLFEEGSGLAFKMTRLNSAISRNCPAGKFITVFLGVLDPVTGVFNYSNAGHNPPIIVRATGAVEKLASGGGPVMGVLANFLYQEASIVMNPGDVLVLYSDGVTESFAPDRDEEFGEDRIADVVTKCAGQPVDSIVQAINDAVNTFTNNAPAADDFTLLVVRRD